MAQLVITIDDAHLDRLREAVGWYSPDPNSPPPVLGGAVPLASPAQVKQFVVLRIRGAVLDYEKLKAAHAVPMDIDVS